LNPKRKEQHAILEAQCRQNISVMTPAAEIAMFAIAPELGFGTTAQISQKKLKTRLGGKPGVTGKNTIKKKDTRRDRRKTPGLVFTNL